MEMVKRYLLTILLSILFASNVSAVTFSWEQVNYVCYGTCGGYILVWEVADYEAACPEDVLENETDTERFIPYPCYEELKAVIKAKIKVLPEGYSTIKFTFRKSDAPMLTSNSKFVSVLIEYECENGRELESDFSNRVVWKTPITIEPFNIILETP